MVFELWTPPPAPHLMCSLVIVVITAGFLETVHRVSEGTALLSVPFMILTPTDISQLSPTLFITLQATVTDGSALS